MRRSGFTLVEILIAGFIGLMVVGAVMALYAVTLRDVDRAQASYGLEQELAKAMRVLQTDLRYTTLASVAAYPKAESEPDQVGISFLASEPVGQVGKVNISRFGTPHWQKHVFYTLLSDSAEGESRLVRYEQALSGDDLEVVSSHLPYDHSGSEDQRLVASHVLSPGYSLQTGSAGEMTLASSSGAPGGFWVSFLQRDGTTTTKNPTENDDVKNITGVLVVQLTLLETSERGKMSALPFQFRVAPRN